MSLRGTPARLLLFACLFLASTCIALCQITNVTDDQSTPIPGAGHDYIHMLSETVNPANGSVSVRIQVPVPKGRGLTLPFAFAYDSNGVHHAVDGPGYGQWSSNTGYLSQGGWAYSVPMLTEISKTATQTVGNVQYTCNYWTNYMFQDPQGGRHSLGLSYVTPGPDCQNITPRPYPVLSAGDDIYQAAMSNFSPLMVADHDGTVYKFTNPGAEDNYAAQADLPSSVEDRNGNMISIKDLGGGHSLSRIRWDGLSCLRQVSGRPEIR